VFRVAPIGVARAAIALALAFCVSAGAADMDRVLRVSFAIAETGFDPQAAGDAYSNYVNRQIFDALYAYDYLARPYAEFNRLYDRARQMPDTPERTKLFHQMSRLVAAYAPWRLDAYRYETVILQPWVMGYKHNVYYQHPWPYLDIDAKRKGSK
jgi:ABC-type transport system substrate-binding protein